MNKLKIGLASICMFLGTSFANAAPSSNIDDYKMLTELYPPYNFVVDGKLQGISVDILSEVLKDMMGAKRNVEAVEVNPWARAYNEVQKKENIMLFSTTRIPEREAMFKWVGPIVSTNNSLIAKKSSKIKINSPQDIEKYKIGVVTDDVADLLVQSLIKDKSKISRASQIEHITLQLEPDRVNVIGFESTGLAWEMKKMGLNPNDYETVYVLKEGDLYFTFSKETPDSLIVAMQASLDKLKSLPLYQEIVKKYIN
jgi:polar amino acid transport system substrate-binding protein